MSSNQISIYPEINFTSVIFRPSPEYKRPNCFHNLQVSSKNSNRERSVSEVTDVGGIHRKFAYFAIQAQ